MDPSEPMGEQTSIETSAPPPPTGDQIATAIEKYNQAANLLEETSQYFQEARTEVVEILQRAGVRNVTL